LLDHKNKLLSKLNPKVVKFLRNSLAFIIRILRKITIPGTNKMPLYDVVIFFLKGLTEGRLTLRASSISFDFFLALFPVIIVFFTLIPFIPITGFQEELLHFLEDVIPSTLWIHVSETLEDIIVQPRSGLLSLGFLLALFFSTNGVNSIIEGFNSSYHTTEKRPYLKQRLVSLYIVLVQSVLVILAVSLFLIGGRILQFLVFHGILTNQLTIVILHIVRWLMIVGLFLVSVSFLYYFAPAKKKEYKFFSIGAIFTSGMMILTTYGFNFYIENFNRYNALYGSIGTLLVFLLWLYFNSIIILIGFELNISINTAKKRFENA
jgi:membrane protein